MRAFGVLEGSGDSRPVTTDMTTPPPPPNHMRIPLWQNRAARLLVVHTALFSISYFLAFFTRADFVFYPRWFAAFLTTVSGVVLLKLFLFSWSGQFRESWSRLSFSDLMSLVSAATVAGLALTFVDSLLISTGILPGIPRVPRSVFLIDWATTILIIGGLRALWRGIREDLRPLLHQEKSRIALIVGANHTGELLARNLQANARNPHLVIGFLDENSLLHGTSLSGIEVIGGIDRAGECVSQRRVDSVIVQSGTLSGKALRQLLADCTASGAAVKVIPAIDELMEGNQADAALTKLRSVEIKDLLRREPVELDDSAILSLVEGRTVLVTGAGGSIGSEICRQVLRFRPRRLLLVEQAENALFLLEQEFSRLKPLPPFEPLVADITDESRMEQIIGDTKPDVIFHAAAHKHVPMMEWNPQEAIKNNCFGTRTLARLADKHGVGKFVAISTDKAVNPTSVMGCSKLIAERYVQALSRTSKTTFIVVRFGNVLGSNGSVVPTFQEQIRRGGPITITHPQIERFFMMIPEASQLVLQAATMGSGGEIFVLDMGVSVKIVDLARDLISLSGLEADDIEIVYTGLRPGEKLFEELYFDDEKRVQTVHPKVFCALHRPADLPQVESMLDELRVVLDRGPAAVRERLRELVPEFGCETTHAPVTPTPTPAPLPV